MNYLPTQERLSKIKAELADLESQNSFNQFSNKISVSPAETSSEICSSIKRQQPNRKFKKRNSE